MFLHDQRSSHSTQEILPLERGLLSWFSAVPTALIPAGKSYLISTPSLPGRLALVCNGPHSGDASQGDTSPCSSPAPNNPACSHLPLLSPDMPSHCLCVRVLHKLKDLESITPRVSLFPTKIRKCTSVTFFPCESQFLSHVLGLPLNPATFHFSSAEERLPWWEDYPADPMLWFSDLHFGSRNGSINRVTMDLSSLLFFLPALKDSTGKKYFTVLGTYGKLTKNPPRHLRRNVLKINRRPESSIFCSKLWLGKKEWNNTIYSNMDGPKDYHTKWSQSDKEKYRMISLICGI